MHIKKYGQCPKKMQARYQTIVESYQHLFGLKVPKNKQYWTLCSQQVSSKGKLILGSELDQLLKLKFITKEQFFGVDRELDVIEKNRKYIPESKWFCGDIYTVLSKQENLDPAIVNCDLIEMPKSGSYLIGKILSLLTRRKIKNVMLVVNFVLSTRYHQVELDDLIDYLIADHNFNLFYTKGDWKRFRLDEAYIYDGTGLKSDTVMGTIVFYKK